ncbi:response regulator [Candidatus Parcubacteria bacterium]|jgi:CheY-like chemotaxis protein|nr:response regulator [Candidatus Parcubacteria bacterium]MBT3949159.1 response regulator [Candidatus Parcubacteria bacterium]
MADETTKSKGGLLESVFGGKDTDKSSKAGKKIIFIVEDDEVLLRALYILFHEEDYTIATATDGQTAVSMAQRLNPDVILLDLLLPKMDGFEVLKALKADPKLKSTPVIVLSNLGDSDSIEKAKKLGSNDYFVKAETDLSILSQKIEKILT